jgi:zinc transporter 1/2/3
VANAISAGILIYNSLVELLARDFLFEPEKKLDMTRLCFMAACVVLGAGFMSLLAKWA